MRHQLGLDLPERRIGLSAHDFAQLLGHDEVILSHAAKVGGAPAVASRFLHRLEAVAGEDALEGRAWRAAKPISTTPHALDRPDKVEPIAQPAPRPPRAARPLQTVGHRDRGLAARSLHHLCQVHPASCRRSTRSTCRCRRPIAARRSTPRSANSPRPLPQVAATIPRACCAPSAQRHFAPLMQRPEARALWWPRFLRIADWFANWETERRLNVAAVISRAIRQT